MRIALHATSEVGNRAGRIMLGERDLEALGLIDRQPRRLDDGRIVPVEDFADFDVVVTDDETPADIVEEALDAGINCVLWADWDESAPDYGAAFNDAFRSLVCGANMATGLGRALLLHETARTGEVLGVRIAWTEPGTPIRRGEPIPFPDPVGSKWARPRGTDGAVETFVAPVTGKWAAAMAQVTGTGGDAVVTRIVGFADLAPHLEALALASAAIVTARDGYAPGLRRPVDAGEVYLTQALVAGLEVASFTLDGARGR